MLMLVQFFSQVDAEATNLKGRNPLHVLANFGHKGDTSVPIFLLFMECMPQVWPLTIAGVAPGSEVPELKKQP